MATSLPKEFPAFEIISIRLGAKIYSVLPPVSIEDFVAILQAAGFHDIRQMTSQNFRGAKGKAEFYIDQIKGVFGVISPNFKDTMNVFDDIIKAIKQYWRVNLIDYIGFYETETVINYHSNKDVYKKISNVYQDSKYMKKFSTLLGTPIGTFNMRLVPHGKSASSEEWFDIILEPKLASAGNIYAVRALYRDKQLAKIRKVTEKVPDTIKQMIKELEK